MTRIGIIVGSTRPGRRADAVARWLHGLAAERGDATYEVVDLAEFDLPMLDEPVPAAVGPDYARPHTRAWAAAVASFDGYVFVTPEYNHSTTGALKNAIDFLFREWNDKAAGLVSYGLQGGTRAAEHLRLVLGELKVADVRTQVALSVRSDFAADGSVRPAEHHVAAAGRMLDEVCAWSRALQPLRDNAFAARP